MVPKEPVQPTLAERLQQKTVALVQTDEDGDVGAFCAGVWVSRDTILTAAHCVRVTLEVPDEMKELFPHGIDFDPIGNDVSFLVYDDVKSAVSVAEKNVKLKTAKVVAYDPNVDMALLHTSYDNHMIAELARRNVHSGDSVNIVGHTIGLWWSYCNGTVSMIRFINGPTMSKDVLTLQ